MNRHHANRPTALTASDHLRMQATIRAHDARKMREARNARLCRLIAGCAGIVLAVALFYSATGA